LFFFHVSSYHNYCIHGLNVTSLTTSLALRADGGLFFSSFTLKQLKNTFKRNVMDILKLTVLEVLWHFQNSNIKIFGAFQKYLFASETWVSLFVFQNLYGVMKSSASLKMVLHFECFKTFKSTPSSETKTLFRRTFGILNVNLIPTRNHVSLGFCHYKICYGFRYRKSYHRT